MWLKNLGLPTDEIEGINSIKVVSRLLDQLRSRAVVEDAKGQSHSLFYFVTFFLSKYQGETVSNALLTKPIFLYFQQISSLMFFLEISGMLNFLVFGGLGYII